MKVAAFFVRVLIHVSVINRIAALPLDVRKVSDLPKSRSLNWGYAPTIGLSPNLFGERDGRSKTFRTSDGKAVGVLLSCSYWCLNLEPVA